MTRILSQLWIYPVKSFGGIPLAEAAVFRRGLQYDRRWMLTDEAGMFITQRENVRLTLLGTAIEGNHLRIFSKKHPEQYILTPLAEPENEKKRVQVWSVKLKAFPIPDPAVHSWLSEQLEQPVILNRMPESAKRAADGRYAPKGQYVSFADGFPFLLIGQASLDDLNARMEMALPMNRFRPNLVFTGGEPYEEDNMQDFSIGDIPFRGVKPCARCIIPTIDQDEATRAAEPLKTLSGYRRQGNKVLFGQNVVWMGDSEGRRVRVGDALKVQ